MVAGARFCDAVAGRPFEAAHRQVTTWRRRDGVPSHDFECRASENLDCFGPAADRRGTVTPWTHRLAELRDNSHQLMVNTPRGPWTSFSDRKRHQLPSSPLRGRGSSVAQRESGS